MSRATDRGGGGPDVGLPTLVGRRVTLRPTTRRDVPALAAILREPAVARWWTRYDTARVRAELVAGRGRDVWAIEVDPRTMPSDDGRDAGAGSDGEAGPAVVVGAVQSWEEADPDYRHAGIDLFVATAAQGRGVGTEAVRLVAAWLIDVRGHHRLTIDPAADNAAAIRAYGKVGFTPVGRLRAAELGPDDAWRDAMLMELLAAGLVREG